MLALAVIADDLTGAADTGVQFQPALAPVYLVSRRFPAVDALIPPPRALSLCTASRSLPPAEAYQVVFDACRMITCQAPQRVYKKIDSALRGNIGAELEAVMAALKIDMSFIAPAFIEQGRTTVDGVHFIDGMPVASTEMRCDPVTQVRESRLADWVGSQTCFPVAHIDLGMMSQGADATSAAIDRAFGRGVRHFTFDANAKEHLLQIVHLALHRYPQSLLCGSAGLAQSMARVLGTGPASPHIEGREGVDALTGHWLFACGSASERLQQQVRALAEEANVMVEILEPVWLATDVPSANRTAAVHRAASRLAAGDVVVRLSPPSPDSRSMDPGRLVAGFAEAVVGVIEASRPAGLFLSGGDTALAVLQRLGTRAVRLEYEVCSGLVFGRLMGGITEGMPVVTKAGAFGPPNALLNLKSAISDAQEKVRR